MTRRILALILAPLLGLAFVWFLPFVGFVVVFQAIVAKLRHPIHSACRT